MSVTILLHEHWSVIRQNCQVGGKAMNIVLHCLPSVSVRKLCQLIITSLLPVVRKPAQHWLQLSENKFPCNHTKDITFVKCLRKTSTVSGHSYKKLHVLKTIHQHWSVFYSELHFTLITEHQQNIISVAISEINDCPDNISTALCEHSAIDHVVVEAVSVRGHGRLHFSH